MKQINILSVKNKYTILIVIAPGSHTVSTYSVLAAVLTEVSSSEWRYGLSNGKELSTCRKITGSEYLHFRGQAV
jgi:hypothetical protein